MKSNRDKKTRYAVAPPHYNYAHPSIIYANRVPNIKKSPNFLRDQKNNRLCDIFLKQEMDNNMFKRANLPIAHAKKPVLQLIFLRFSNPFLSRSRLARYPRSQTASFTLYRFRLTVDSLISSILAACLTLPCASAS